MNEDIRLPRSQPDIDLVRSLVGIFIGAVLAHFTQSVTGSKSQAAAVFIVVIALLGILVDKLGASRIIVSADRVVIREQGWLGRSYDLRIEDIARVRALLSDSLAFLDIEDGDHVCRRFGAWGPGEKIEVLVTAVAERLRAQIGPSAQQTTGLAGQTVPAQPSLEFPLFLMGSDEQIVAFSSSGRLTRRTKAADVDAGIYSGVFDANGRQLHIRAGNPKRWLARLLGKRAVWLEIGDASEQSREALRRKLIQSLRVTDPSTNLPTIVAHVRATLLQGRAPIWPSASSG